MLLPTDAKWSQFSEFIGLSHLKEVRSIDSYLNPCRGANYSGDTLANAIAQLKTIPQIEDAFEYYLMFVDADAHPMFNHPQLSFLGYDLSDETWTSSLLNCGKWEGRLESLAVECQENGLLDLPAAKKAQTLLPTEWDDDPHSNVTIWALYEMTHAPNAG